MRLGRVLTAAVMSLLLVGHARADMASDEPAAIVFFPKLVVDTHGVTGNDVDTLVRLSNVSTTPLQLLCFLVDATPQCVDNSGSCLVPSGQPGACSSPAKCLDKWTETDFRIILTSRQPIGWRVSQGMIDCRNTADPNQPCFQLDGVTRRGPGNQSNQGSRIPPVPEDPFIGDLQCLAVDSLFGTPVPRNDLKGEALIVRTDVAVTSVDTDGYNGIGMHALPGLNTDSTLCLGGCSPGQCSVTKTRKCFTNGDCPSGERCSLSVCSITNQTCSSDANCPSGERCALSCVRNDLCPTGAEYDGCPNVLILDHFFDGAVDPVSQLPVVTDLTLVPCTQDYLRQKSEETTVQFLVFNEFEQRFSTSRPIKCFKEIQISNIDTNFNDRSIFSAAVMGTMTGQTRIRGVGDNHTDHGHALLGVAREFRCAAGSPLGECGVVSTAASNLQYQGRRPDPDFVYLPGG